MSTYIEYQMRRINSYETMNCLNIDLIYINKGFV